MSPISPIKLDDFIDITAKDVRGKIKKPAVTVENFSILVNKCNELIMIINTMQDTIDYLKGKCYGELDGELY